MTDGVLMTSVRYITLQRKRNILYGTTNQHKSPDESLGIKTKHWAAMLSVGIHHIGGGAAIATAIVIRLAYLQRFILNIGTLR